MVACECTDLHYGYGWYVTLIWVPLYNALSARGARWRDRRRFTAVPLWTARSLLSV
jgi:hypothetical protein